MNQTLAQLKKAIAEARKKDQEACRLIERAFPAGKRVQWWHGNQLREGKVIEVHAIRLRCADIHVRTPKGASVAISAHRIIDLEVA